MLDAGCGTGGFLAVLAARRGDLDRFGFGWEHEAVCRARDKSGAWLTRGSVNALPFDGGQFDAAVSAGVLCHRPVEPALALGELRRVLRPGGRLSLNLPAYQWLMAAHDLRVHNDRRFTAAEVVAMLRQSGFARARTRYWNGVLLPLMVLQGKTLTRSGRVSDVAPFPPWLDAMFHAMTAFERHLPIRLPAGESVLAIAEKS